MFDSLYQPDLSICFIWITLLTLFIFLNSFLPGIVSLKNKIILFLILSSWLALQGIIASHGFYLNFTGLPPRLALAISPTIIAIILLVVFKKNSWMYYFSIKKLTWIHIVRLPVELILWGLYIDKQIPQLMTFEGRNFDIISGLTAPLIIYFCFIKNILNKKIALIWNFVCLGLLLNILINGILSTPIKIQLFAFNQPNIAVAFFPFIWLPCFVVPIILFSHVVCIVQLTSDKK